MIEIIDSHVHITENGKWMNTIKDSSLGRLFDEMKVASVQKVVLIAIDGIVSNDFISKIYSENPEIFIPFCSVNPAITKFNDFLDIKKKGNFIGMKIHPRLQQFSLKDKIVNDFFELVEEIPNFLVMLDCWFSDDDPIELVKEFIDFISSFNKVKFILAHSGGFHYDSIIPLASKSNVFLDLSYTPIILKKYRNDLFNDFFKRLKRIDSSKLLFGSDFPEFSIKESLDFLQGTLKEHCFSKTDKVKIFSRNIKNIVNKI